MVPVGVRWSHIDKMVTASLLWRFCSFYMCVLRLLLGKSNIALFALRFTFGHIGGDTFEAVKEEPCYGGVYMVVSARNKILDASTQVLSFLFVFSDCAFGRIQY